MKRLSKNGFTLVEIIVVVVILAVLLAVAVPAVLNYLDEADDAKCIAEAKSILTSSEKYLVHQYADKRKMSEPYTGYLSTDEKEKIVNEVNGNGVLNSLYYEDGVIQTFTYYINHKYVLFLGYNKQFIIKESMYANVAEAIISSQKLIDEMNIYFSSRPNNASIDSEAGVEGFNGIANTIREELKGLGVDTSDVSWQVMSVAIQNGKKRYQFLVTDKKLTVDMNGQSIKATKYIYFEDGTPDESINSHGEGNFNVQVDCQIITDTIGNTTYAKLKK